MSDLIGSDLQRGTVDEMRGLAVYQQRVHLRAQRQIVAACAVEERRALVLRLIDCRGAERFDPPIRVRYWFGRHRVLATATVGRIANRA